MSRLSKSLRTKKFTIPGQTGKQRQCIHNIINRPDSELSIFYRIQQWLGQRKVTHISGRNNNALIAGEFTALTNFKKAFDFFVQAADRLCTTELIDRAGNSYVLMQGHIGQGADYRTQFGHGCAITIHFTIGLFKC